MSNTKLILMVITAFVLLIVFGRNPMDEVRKKRAERAGRKLVEKIEESNKKKGGSPLIVPMPNYPVRFNTNKAPVGAYRNGGNPGQQNPYLQQQKNPNQQQPQQPNPNEYYPPAPKNPNVQVPLSSLPQSNPLTQADRACKNPNLITDDGHDLAFWGTKVYVYDKDGKLKPMPDGQYSMYAGTYTMVVRDGEQTIGNGDTVDWRK